jgi:hypothetical protein
MPPGVRNRKRGLLGTAKRIGAVRFYPSSNIQPVCRDAMNTNLDAVTESIHRSVQFRGPLHHEADVRRIATELLTAMKSGALSTHDIRTIADCLETGVRKTSRMTVV